MNRTEPSLPRRDFLRLGALAGMAAAAVPALARPSRALAATPTTAPVTPAASSFSPLRPPATPLAVRSPYLSTWLPADNLPGTWPAFWNGRVTAICGIARIDGVAYVFAGAPGTPSLPAMTQTALELTATRSRFTLTAAGVTLTVTFFSPVDPENLRRQSMPLSYLTVQAASADTHAHQVSVYVDLSAEWVHGDNSTQVRWASQTAGGLTAHTCTPASPAVLAENHDQASWGSLVVAADSTTGLTWQIAQDTVARTAGSQGALPNTVDTGQPRAINDRWPVFAFARDLGAVTGPSAEFVVCLGHVRDPGLSYQGTALRPWWTAYWSSWQDMLVAFRADLDAARRGADALDARILREATAAGGTQYAALCALALRQAYGGTDLVSYQGQPWAFQKEISSSGNVSTVDVLYPSFPAYLHLSPNFLKLLLAPVLAYAESGLWPQAYAEHDVGASYPNAAGHNDGGGENMPVEESANMLIMAAAVIRALPPDQASAYASAHYTILRSWAEYLVANALDPGYQNQTDDFTGFIAHSVNLALKGIVGIGAMSIVAAAAGNAADQSHYLSVAQSYIGQWAQLGADGQHLRLAYDQPGTWSLKYNGYPDRLLGLNLVPDSVATTEANWYLANQHAYGVELDPRHTYTKVDWELWTAGFLAAHPQARDLFVSKAYAFANGTPTRVAFTDWYDTDSGAQVGFVARPVVGGMFTLLTLANRPNGLVGAWACDEGGGTVARDSGGAGLDAALATGASWVAGPPGQAGSALSGTAATAGPVLDTSTSFSVTAWVKLASTGGFATAVSQDGAVNSGFYLQYSAADDRWAFARVSADATAPAGARALSAAAPAVGTWTHLTGVYDAAAGQLRLYVNGQRGGTAAFTTPWNATGAFTLGRGRYNGATADPFPGAVAGVRAYQRALTDAEAAAAATLGNGLAGAWTLDEGSGTVARDRSGGGHDAAVSGSWAAGYGGTGTALSGTAATTASVLDTSASFTVAAWVNLSSTAGFATAVSQDGTTASGFYLQYSGADNRWAFARVAADATDPASARALSPSAPAVGRWTHLAGVHDAAAGLLRLYVDGRPAGTAPFTTPWKAGGPLVIGRGRYNGAAVDTFPGAVDQVRAWSRALSDTEIRVLT
ncbi:MAG: glutaminase domain-containing protein [Mycobacteriales bacterium]